MVLRQVIKINTIRGCFITGVTLTSMFSSSWKAILETVPEVSFHTQQQQVALFIAGHYTSIYQEKDVDPILETCHTTDRFITAYPRLGRPTFLHRTKDLSIYSVQIKENQSQDIQRVSYSFSEELL
jgi:hypothetical protein